MKIIKKYIQYNKWYKSEYAKLTFFEQEFLKHITYIQGVELVISLCVGVCLGWVIAHG